MNKYYGNMYGSPDSIEGQLMPDESVIWKGTPKKSAFILNSTIKMAPVALIWLFVDGTMISSFAFTGMMKNMMWFVVPFFVIHLLPVWIWIYQIITAAGRWKNTEYAVTNKRIILRNGLVGYQYQTIYYTEISNVSLHVGAIDRMLGVGDVYILMNAYANTGKDAPVILDVEEPQRVYAMLQQTVMDVQTDIHYPNALRPESNPGYHTQYRP
ncbi:MAG: PH domain-containing protein [Lachnospiraceae bacterium]|nr:PH domain-containing protein [Lachnospiraceae bacterium]